MGQLPEERLIFSRESIPQPRSLGNALIWCVDPDGSGLFMRERARDV